MKAIHNEGGLFVWGFFFVFYVVVVLCWYAKLFGANARASDLGAMPHAMCAPGNEELLYCFSDQVSLFSS